MKLNIQITLGSDVPTVTAKQAQDQERERYLATIVPMAIDMFQKLYEGWKLQAFWRSNGAPPSNGAGDTTRPSA